MNMKLSALAAAITASLAMGAAGQASADVYGGSSLHIDQLTIAVLDSTGAPAIQGGVTVNSFNYTLTNTAVLNNIGAIQSNTCGGTPAFNSCGIAPALDAAAANAPGSTINRVNNQVAGADNTMTWFGIGGGNWSNSDSIIHVSELTSGNPTHTDQIAESNISSAKSASANAEIKSVTGFTFSFTVADPGPFSLALNFMADPDLRAQILNDIGLSYAAGANMNVSFTLTQNTGGNGFVNWNPQGTAANDCAAIGGANCVETADSEDLNVNVGTTSNNTTSDYSYGPNIPGLGNFGIFVTNLASGNWTLTLNAVTSTNLTRVPEPGILGLMGIGLAGMGFAARRKNRA